MRVGVHQRTWIFGGSLMLLAAFSSGRAQGQSTQVVPDTGDILRETERQFQPEPPRVTPQAKPVEPVLRSPEGPSFVVRGFQLEGVTLIDSAQIQARLVEWLDREISFADLEDALAAIVDVYQRSGWLARTQLPEQELGDDGIVIINIIEGRLGAIQFDASTPLPLKEQQVLGFLTREQATGDPLNMARVTRALTVLNELAGVQLNAALAPSITPQSSDLIVSASPLPAATASVSLDNAGGRSTGRNRLSIRAGVDNPLKVGDRIGTNLMASDGIRYAQVDYSRPVGYAGLQLGLNAGYLRYTLQGEFASSDGKGGSNSYGLSARYPLQRSGLHNSNLGFNLDHKHLFNEANGINTSDKALQTVTVNYDGDYSDSLGGGGINLWRAALSYGDADLSANAEDAATDRETIDSQGNYAKIALTVSRLQRITDQHSLWLSVNGQLSNKNLESSEKFSLGGSQGVRAYPASEASGDHGYLATLELRNRISERWQVSGFYDYGWVKQYHNDDFTGAPTGEQTDYALSGWGINFNYSLAGRFSSSLTYARRIGNNPGADANGNDGDGTHDQDRIWWSAVAYF